MIIKSTGHSFVILMYIYPSPWLATYWKNCGGGGAVGYSVRLASGRLVVRIPAATDLSRKDR